MQSKSLIYSSDTRNLLSQAIHTYHRDTTVSYDSESRVLYISIPHIADYRLDGDTNSITIEHIRSIVEERPAERIKGDLEGIINELSNQYL